MENIIIIVIIALAVTFAVRYIIKTKKKGNKCIGCPIGCKSCEQFQKNGFCGGCIVATNQETE